MNEKNTFGHSESRNSGKNMESKSLDFTQSAINIFSFLNEMGVGVGTIDRAGFIMDMNHHFQTCLSPKESVVIGETNLLDLIQMQNRQMVTSSLSSFYDEKEHQFVLYVDYEDRDEEFLRLHFSNPASLKGTETEIVVLCERVQDVGDNVSKGSFGKGSFLEEFLRSKPTGFWTYNFDNDRLILDPNLQTLLGHNTSQIEWDTFISFFETEDQGKLKQLCFDSTEEKHVFYHSFSNSDNHQLLKHHLRVIRDKEGGAKFAIGYLTQIETTDFGVQTMLTNAMGKWNELKWGFDILHNTVFLPQSFSKEMLGISTPTKLKTILALLDQNQCSIFLEMLRNSIYLPIDEQLHEYEVTLKNGLSLLLSWKNTEEMSLNRMKLGSINFVDEESGVFAEEKHVELDEKQISSNLEEGNATVLNEQKRKSFLFDKVLNHSQEAVVLIDVFGAILFANTASKKLFSNIDQKKHIYDLFAIPKAVVEKHLHDTIRLSNASSSFVIKGEEECVVKMKSVYWFDGVDEGAICCYLSSVAQPDQATLGVEQAALKTAFLSTISHEIRTPMNAILGFAELLQDESLTKQEQKEFIDHISTQSNQILDLVSKIMFLSKLDSKEWEIRPVEVTLDLFLNELKSRLKVLKDNWGKQKLQTSIQCTVPKADRVVKLDVINVKNAFVPILENAVKYTEIGRVDVKCDLLASNKLHFRIIDTGIGITKEKCNEIFDFFLEGGNWYTRKFQGPGVGLALAKKLIEKMHGNIWVESEVGKGSTFHITLPYVPSLSTSIDFAEESVEVKATDFNWSTKRILIIDDTTFILDILSRILEPTQAKTIGITTVKEAFQLLEQGQHFDVVLLDIQMPVVSGLEFLKVAKQQYVDLPIIAQTAFADEEHERELREMGADDFIPKPIETDLLLVKINAIFKRNR